MLIIHLCFCIFWGNTLVYYHVQIQLHLDFSKKKNSFSLVAYHFVSFFVPSLSLSGFPPNLELRLQSGGGLPFCFVFAVVNFTLCLFFCCTCGVPEIPLFSDPSAQVGLSPGWLLFYSPPPSPPSDF